MTRTLACMLVASVLVIGCTGEGDLRERWVQEYDDAAGITRVADVDCDETFPGDFRGCRVELVVDEELSASAAARLVEQYPDRASTVYGADAGKQLGRLALVAGTTTYVFDPTPTVDGDAPDQPRDAASEDALTTFRQLVGDARFDEAEVVDAGGDAGTSIILHLPDGPAEDAWGQVVELAEEFPDAPRLYVTARAAEGDDTARVRALRVTVEDGRAPTAEWELAGQVLAREQGSYDVTLEPDRVHLVLRVDADPSSDRVRDRVAAIRARVAASAPELTSTSVGVGPASD